MFFDYLTIVLGIHALLQHIEVNDFIFTSSQGHIRSHRQDLLLLDTRLVEGDRLHQIAIPGAHRLLDEDTCSLWRSEACRAAVLNTLHPLSGTR